MVNNPGSNDQPMHISLDKKIPMRDGVLLLADIIDEAVLKVGKPARALSRIAESLTVRDSGPCWLVMLAIAADGTPEKLDTLP